MKAVLLAATFMIDYLFFEEDNKYSNMKGAASNAVRPAGGPQ